MSASFDIFRIENHGMCWLEAAVTLAHAKARVQELAILSPRAYLILNQNTEDKVVIQVAGRAADWRSEETTMSDLELEFPGWQVPLQELILEFDRKQLPKRMQEVETLILERLQQLRQQSDGHRECEALNDALSTLRVIKRDRLGFPDGK
jgi:hypothetical protein